MCPSLFSSCTNAKKRSQLEFIWLQVYSPAIREITVENQGRNLEARTKSEEWRNVLTGLLLPDFSTAFFIQPKLLVQEYQCQQWVGHSYINWQ